MRLPARRDERSKTERIEKCGVVQINQHVYAALDEKLDKHPAKDINGCYVYFPARRDDCVAMLDSSIYDQIHSHNHPSQDGQGSRWTPWREAVSLAPVPGSYRRDNRGTSRRVVATSEG